MKKIILNFIFLAFLGFNLTLIKVSAQEEGADLLTIFNRVDKGPGKNVSWSGIWSYGSRYSPGTLKITAVSKIGFKFRIEALNGANTGEISGAARIKGGKAYFDDKTDSKNSSKAYGCRMLFINKGRSIEIKTSSECSYYGGNGVVLGGEYRKGKPVIKENNFVQLEVFPNPALDRKFKSLVGKEYENFLDDFQLINEDEDLDNLSAKVFSACVRGICPYNAGIIMFDGKGNIWAAVTNLDIDRLTRVYYFTNNSAWTEKLPKTIEKWVADKRSMNENLKVIFKSKK